VLGFKKLQIFLDLLNIFVNTGTRNPPPLTSIKLGTAKAVLVTKAKEKFAMTLNNITGDINQDGVVNANDAHLFEELLNLDDVFADGVITEDEADQINEKLAERGLNSDYSPEELHNLLDINQDNNIDIKDMKLVQFQAYLDIFAELGIDGNSLELTLADLQDGAITYDELNQDAITEECFQALFGQDGITSLDELVTVKEMFQAVLENGLLGPDYTTLEEVASFYFSSEDFVEVDLEAALEHEEIQTLLTDLGYENNTAELWVVVQNLLSNGEISVQQDTNGNGVQDVSVEDLLAYVRQIDLDNVDLEALFSKLTGDSLIHNHLTLRDLQAVNSAEYSLAERLIISWLQDSDNFYAATGGSVRLKSEDLPKIRGLMSNSDGQPSAGTATTASDFYAKLGGQTNGLYAYLTQRKLNNLDLSGYSAPEQEAITWLRENFHLVASQGASTTNSDNKLSLADLEWAFAHYPDFLNQALS
jgi:hypothetical protein